MTDEGDVDVELTKKEKAQAYRDAHRPEIAEYNRRYKEKNKQKVKEYNQQYRENNKEWVKEANNKYYNKHKEKVSTRHKEYYEDNKEALKKYSREYYHANKEKRRAYNAANKDKIAADARKSYEKRKAKAAQQLLEVEGGKKIPEAIDTTRSITTNE